MTFIVKSRWGMYTVPTEKEAVSERDRINEQDTGWDLTATAEALNANPVETADEVPSS